MSNTVVVIPSIRTITLDYLTPLGDTPIIVVDDAGGAVTFTEQGREVPQPPHITKIIASAVDNPSADVVPQKNPSCKGFGLLQAYREGYARIILLDDDCDVRVSPDYLQDIPVGNEVGAVQAHKHEPWFNTLALLRGSEGNAAVDQQLFARGIPYHLRANQKPFHRLERVLVRSSFNEGLWSGTPDICGIDKIQRGDVGITMDRIPVVDTMTRKPSVHLLHVGQQLPLSIMNVQLTASLVPAFYQPPDWPMPGGFSVRRHDDVWSMYILKALMDVAGLSATVGGPIIHHRKAGDMLKEAVSEQYTNALQPYFEQSVDAAVTHCFFGGSGAVPFVEAVDAFAQAWPMVLRRQQEWDKLPPSAVRVLTDYASRFARWVALFR